MSKYYVEFNTNGDITVVYQRINKNKFIDVSEYGKSQINNSVSEKELKRYSYPVTDISQKIIKKLQREII